MSHPAPPPDPSRSTPVTTVPGGAVVAGGPAGADPGPAPGSAGHSRPDPGLADRAEPDDAAELRAHGPGAAGSELVDREVADPEDAGPEDVDPDEAAATRDWGWIEEWREGREPTPWGYGVALAAFAALLTMVGVIALAQSLAGQPWVAVIVNLVVAGGVAPALWLCRGLPVLRWVAAGVAAGFLLGWIGALAVVTPT